ncbi:MAG: 4'-phosphopantetheinyl transferase superfamily protein [Gammaproteobacteria bacterium]|jgi:4'-phosphopantetheinyl transferase EntD|nr:4'-phosphopantetheinyl transferase superfamily protein [Gammaproteobacteria bacterium]MDP6615775.1 4'-phosphopantetheinyl transferase superfamily protein [Gammaproteobacteria bacterium]MDP6695539.1 4'-phosphopantetheinyl transferase superfamily protein [Gammaproteobacteria bacterium]
MRDSEIQSLLTELFPDQVAVCFSTGQPSESDLLPEELAHTKKMVGLRRLEFAQGRACARAALESLGLPPDAIPTGSNREPLWPEGVVGSISHTDGAAAAVVGHGAQFAGLGLDMESAEPLGDDLVELICRPDEEGRENGKHAKLLFSIKEAIYKCIYPTVQTFVDFQEMKVKVDAGSHSFAAEAHTPACEQALVNRLEGKFRIAGELILSSAWLRSR